LKIKVYYHAEHWLLFDIDCPETRPASYLAGTVFDDPAQEQEKKRLK
jgi:hypothetical protein